jgi:hypothetical protein
LQRTCDYATRIRPLIERRAEQATKVKERKLQLKMYGTLAGE